jgi:hypothetical protein
MAFQYRAPVQPYMTTSWGRYCWIARLIRDALALLRKPWAFHGEGVPVVLSL